MWVVGGTQLLFSTAWCFGVLQISVHQLLGTQLLFSTASNRNKVASYCLKNLSSIGFFYKTTRKHFLSIPSNSSKETPLFFENWYLGLRGNAMIFFLKSLMNTVIDFLSFPLFIFSTFVFSSFVCSCFQLFVFSSTFDFSSFHLVYLFPLLVLWMPKSKTDNTFSNQHFPKMME